jgi:hypothetical protein
MKLAIVTLMSVFSISAFAFGGGNPANFPSMNGQFFQCSKFGNPQKCQELKDAEAKRKARRAANRAARQKKN